MSDLRAIDVSGLVAPAQHPGVEPELAWVGIDRIVIDDSYQRPLGKKNRAAIQKIADHFDWGHFAPCLVSPLGDGRFALIDGQHRTHAAKLAGADRVPCLVVPMPRDRQAAAFAWVNGQVTAMSVFHVLKAALASRAPWAVAADAAVTGAGCRLMTFNKSARSKKPGEVYCVGLIRRMVELRHDAAVRRGLGAIVGSRHAGDVWLYSSQFLEPWLMLLTQSDVATQADLVPFLDSIEPLRLSHRADDMRASPEHAGTSHKVMLRRLLQAECAAFVGAALERNAPEAAPVPRTAAAPRVAVPAPVSGTPRPAAPKAAQALEHAAPRGFDQAQLDRIRKSCGRYEALSGLATEWRMPVKRVVQAWHRVRVSA